MKNYIAEILKGNFAYTARDIYSAIAFLSKVGVTALSDLKSSFFENISLVYICVLYYLSTFAIGKYLGVHITGSLDFYYLIFYQYLFAFFFLIWSGATVIYLINNPKTGFAGIPIIWSKLRKDYLSSITITRFIVIFSIIPLFMCSYSSIKQSITLFNSFSFDPWLYQVDKILHFNSSPWEILQPLIGYPIITRFFDFCYLAWGSLFVYSLLYMACHGDKRLRLQFFISLACCWILIGNFLAIVFTSAGPCYYSQVTGTAASPYAGLFAYLQSVPGLKAVGIQSVLWQSFEAGQFMPLGGISAMPSMHVSIAVLLALLHRKMSRWMGWVFIGFAIIVQIGSVHLGWHYAVDGYLSGVLTIVIWNVTGKKLLKYQEQ